MLAAALGLLIALVSLLRSAMSRDMCMLWCMQLTTLAAWIAIAPRCTCARRTQQYRAVTMESSLQQPTTWCVVVRRFLLVRA